MSAAIARTPRTAAARTYLPSVAAIVGGLAVIVGSSLPWLSTLAGLQVLTGFDGANGKILAAGGAVVVALGVAGLRSGSTRVQWAASLLGFALLAFSAWLLLTLMVTVRQAADNPFALASVGPGLFVTTAGGALAFAPLLWMKSWSVARRQ